MNDVIIYQMNLDNVFVILTFFLNVIVVLSVGHIRRLHSAHTSLKVIVFHFQFIRCETKWFFTYKIHKQTNEKRESKNVKKHFQLITHSICWWRWHMFHVQHDTHFTLARLTRYEDPKSTHSDIGPLVPIERMTWWCHVTINFISIYWLW